ncbi:MAG TPA: hypothetical protein VF411_15455 [Bacteroidia bacterium]
MEKEFMFSKRIVNLSLIVGGCALASGVLLVFLGAYNAAFFIAFGALFLYIGNWQKNNKPIILMDDHFIMKAAPIAPKKMILYKDMKSLGGDLVKKAFIIYDEAGKEKKLFLPLPSLVEDDRQVLIKELQERIAKKG